MVTLTMFLRCIKSGGRFGRLTKSVYRPTLLKPGPGLGCTKIRRVINSKKWAQVKKSKFKKNTMKYNGNPYGLEIDAGYFIKNMNTSYDSNKLFKYCVYPGGATSHLPASQTSSHRATYGRVQFP